MKTNRLIIYAAIATMGLCSSCSEDSLPTDGLIGEQVEASGNSDGLVNAITKYISTPTNPDKNYGDCGYPSMMIYRDIMTADMPVRDLGYYYFSQLPYAVSLGDKQLQTDIWNHYYGIILRCNLALKSIKADDDSQALNLATARAYRALAYLELAQMYEFFPTGTSIDSYYNELKGLTVPIVTETTTETQCNNNPRAPFYQMYRYILTDLNVAEEAIGRATTSGSKNKADKAVVSGLKARLWLTLGTRFERFPDDLTTALAYESQSLGENLGSGYTLDPLAVASAEDAFANAAQCAREAISQGNTPLSEDEWSNPSTGFNSSSVSSWLLAVLLGSSDEMCTYYTWQSWVSYMCPEADYGVASLNYKATHMIDKALFDKINPNDWRRYTWVDPDDLEEGKEAFKRNYASRTLYSFDEWSQCAPYTGIKFHPAQGEREASTTGNGVDIPLMRIEEMYFIEAEAAAHCQGLAQGVTLLETFMNNYRINGGTYACTAASIDDFTSELMVQKRIEFWGEGICYFDMRRLGYAVVRRYEDTNHPSSYRLNSFEGYVPAWSTIYIPRREANLNSAVLLNPDPSEVTSAYK